MKNIQPDELLEYKNHIKNINLDELLSMSTIIDRFRFPEKYQIIMNRINELKKYKKLHLSKEMVHEIKPDWFVSLKCWWWNTWRINVISLITIIIILPIILFLAAAYRIYFESYKTYILVVVIGFSLILSLLIDFFVFNHFLKADMGNFSITIANELKEDEIVEPLPGIALKLWWWRLWRYFLIYLLLSLATIIIETLIIKLIGIGNKGIELLNKSILSLFFYLSNIYMYHKILNSKIASYSIKIIEKNNLFQNKFTIDDN